MVVLLLISATLVGYVRLADPGMDSPVPEVQQDAEPHEKAATALRKLSAVDSKITITKSRNGTEYHRSTLSISPDQSVMRLRKITGGEYGAYYTDGGMWYQSGADSSWTYRSNVGYFPEANPFDTSQIRDTPPDRVVREGSTVVLNYTDTTPHLFLVTEFTNYYRGGMTGMQIYFDSSTERVNRIDVRLWSGDHEATLTYEFEYGEIDVERPSGVPRVALTPLVNDLRNVYRKIDRP